MEIPDEDFDDSLLARTRGPFAPPSEERRETIPYDLLRRDRSASYEKSGIAGGGGGGGGARRARDLRNRKRPVRLL